MVPQSPAGRALRCVRRPGIAYVGLILCLATRAAVAQDLFPTPAATDPHPTRWYPLPTTDDAFMEQVLDAALEDVDFERTPVPQVAEWLDRHLLVAVRLGREALNPESSLRDATLTLHAPNLEARHVLAAIEDAGFVVALRPNLIVIGASGCAADSVLRCYPVRDLLVFESRWQSRFCECWSEFHDPRDAYCNWRRPPGGPDDDTRDHLIEVVCSTVRPDEWQVNGGCGSLSFVGDVLVVQTTLRVHAELAGLLASLRAAAAKAEADLAADVASGEAFHRTSAPGRYAPFLSRTASELRFERALDQVWGRPVDLRCEFRDALARLSERCGVVIQLDPEAQEAQVFDVHRPVVLPGDAPTARQALRRVLEQAQGPECELAYAVRPWGVVITPGSRLPMTTRVYATHDLLARLDAQRLVRPLPRYAVRLSQPLAPVWPSGRDMIVETLTSHVEPDSWQVSGGLGSLMYFGPLLVVRQARGMGDPVLDALNTFDAALRDAGRGSTP